MNTLCPCPTPGRICGRTPTYKTAWCPNCLLYEQREHTSPARASIPAPKSPEDNNTKTRIGSWICGGHISPRLLQRSIQFEVPPLTGPRLGASKAAWRARRAPPSLNTSKRSYILLQMLCNNRIVNNELKLWKINFSFQKHPAMLDINVNKYDHEVRTSSRPVKPTQSCSGPLAEVAPDPTLESRALSSRGANACIIPPHASPTWNAY